MLDFLRKTNTEGLDASRIIAFRYYLIAITCMFLAAIVLELAIDLENIALLYVVVLAAIPALLLSLSILRVRHKMLVMMNIFFLLITNQVQILFNPEIFHTWVFWVGLIPLLLTMFTQSRETIALIALILVFIIANGVYVSTKVDAYPVTISPTQFMVSGVFFALITATVASLFGYTQHAVHKRLVNQNLTLKLMTAEIEEQNKMLKEKNEEITSINNRLEERVAERTLELEDHNRKLAEYAFINSHLLRGPLCSILGLINLLNNTSLSEKEKEILMHLKESSHNLDDVVSKISKALSNGPELDRDLIRNLKEK
jgi:signal transduction histidine kinase